MLLRRFYWFAPGLVGLVFLLAVGVRRTSSVQLGQTLIEIVPPSGQICELHIGEKAELQFRIVNRGRTAVRVLGAQASCACTVVAGLPITIAPARSGVVQVRVAAGEDAHAGVFERRLHLFTDSEQYFPEIYFIERVVDGSTD